MKRFFSHAIVYGLLVSGAGFSVPVMAAPFSYVVLEPDMQWAYTIRKETKACDIRLSGPTFDVVAVDEGVRLELPGTTAWTQPGQPRLPVFPAVFQVDPAVIVSIEVVPGDFREIPVGDLLPETERVSVSDDDSSSRIVERRLPDATIYMADAFWPSAMYEINEAKGGGQRYVRIGLMPFQYHPLSQTLRYYPDLTVTVRFSEPEQPEIVP